jgi:antitoxin (DNA-binding transcriptional repressor) of toxin-antitoxin stability system
MSIRYTEDAVNGKALTVTEAVRHFSDYISRVAYRHETFVLCKGKKPVAELRPVPRGRRLGDLPAVVRSLPHLSRADADAFADDIEASRAAVAAADLRDPWAS